MVWVTVTVPLISRTAGNSMVMEYPALTKGELVAREKKWTKTDLEREEKQDNTLREYAADEVLILYPLLNEFFGLSNQEFSLLWDIIINEKLARETELKPYPNAKKLFDNENNKNDLKKTMIDLRNILTVANIWRKSYESKINDFTEIGLSIRDTMAVVKEYARCRNVKQAYLTVFHVFSKNPKDGLSDLLGALEKELNNLRD
jgi:hypothetical protein